MMANSSWTDASEIQQWLAVDETAKTVLRRLHERRAPSIAPLPPLHRTTLHGRNVLEIAGPSGSGKTELLLQSVVSCILPKEWEGLSLGGSEKPVLYLDLDCRFDIRRLVHLLERRIHDVESRLYDVAWEMYHPGGGQTPHTNVNFFKKHSMGTAVQELSKTSALESVSYPKGSERLIRTLIKTCLQRFYLRRCHSSFEFLVALKTMRAFMYQVAAQHGTTAELLILDSIGAFYWLERTTRSVSAQSGRKALNLWTVSEAAVNELHQVVQLHPKLLIMATKTLILKSWQNENLSSWNGRRIGRRNPKLHRPGCKKIPQKLFRSDKYSSSTTEEGLVEQSGHRDFLPASWRGLVTHRIILQGPYESELAPTDRFRNVSPSFFTAEWDKPFSDRIDFFVIQDDGIKLAN